MKIRWSQHAYDSLTDVLDYTFDTFGLRQQSLMENTIMASIDKLGDFPTICPIIPEISNNVREYRKMVVTKEISIIYWIDGEFVNISFIWDTRRSLHQIYYVIKDE